MSCTAAQLEREETCRTRRLCCWYGSGREKDPKDAAGPAAPSPSRGTFGAQSEYDHVGASGEFWLLGRAPRRWQLAAAAGYRPVACA